MVYITDKSNYIDIPKHDQSSAELFTLELENIINNETFRLENLKDANLNKMYYKFYDVDFSGLVTGEYNYRIIADGKQLENGILVCGDYKGTKIEYHKENKSIQYEG